MFDITNWRGHKVSVVEIVCITGMGIVLGISVDGVMAMIFRVYVPMALTVIPCVAWTTWLLANV